MHECLLQILLHANLDWKSIGAEFFAACEILSTKEGQIEYKEHQVAEAERIAHIVAELDVERVAEIEQKLWRNTMRAGGKCGQAQIARPTKP